MKVFLLSNEEIHETILALEKFGMKDLINCYATEYSKREGDLLREWWLRSPSLSSENASTFDPVFCFGGEVGQHVNLTDLLVRPAIWMDLDSTEIYR